MIYTLPRLLYVRIVGIERPAMSAHGQAGTLADAIGMQLIATSIYLSAYRLVLRVSLRCVAASHKRPQYTNNSYSDSSWWNNCENTRYQVPIPGTCEERFHGVSQNCRGHLLRQQSWKLIFLQPFRYRSSFVIALETIDDRMSTSPSCRTSMFLIPEYQSTPQSHSKQS
jgi:hypothetical protein